MEFLKAEIERKNLGEHMGSKIEKVAFFSFLSTFFPLCCFTFLEMLVRTPTSSKKVSCFS